MSAGEGSECPHRPRPRRNWRARSAEKHHGSFPGRQQPSQSGTSNTHTTAEASVTLDLSRDIDAEAILWDLCLWKSWQSRLPFGFVNVRAATTTARSCPETAASQHPWVRTGAPWGRGGRGWEATRGSGSGGRALPSAGTLQRAPR